MTVKELHQILEPAMYPTVTTHWLEQLLQTDANINYDHWLPTRGIQSSRDESDTGSGRIQRRLESSKISLLVGSDGMTSKG